jgi:hypothetical protein
MFLNPVIEINRKRSNSVYVFLLSPENGNMSSFPNAVFSISRIPDDGQKPQTKKKKLRGP